nr:DUF550 domain-containing protein [Klebsiella variicola]
MTRKLTSEILDDETLAELIAFRRSRVEYCQKEGLPYQKALHDSMMLALEELQERRKPLQDKDLQGVIDALEHPAGINAAGKQVVRHALVELQERRKADSEPMVKKVACWSCQNEVEIADIADCDGCCPKCGTRIHLDEEPYIAPLSAPDRDQVRQEHAEWSQATFGNFGPVGPLKHLRREVLETIAKPHDLIEWADMQFLLWDAQRRAGITDEQITQAMIDKLAVNKQRSWPEPKDGEPRLHIKEQPAPVVPDFKKLARELVDNLVDCGGLDEGVKEKYLEWAEKTCRAAMLAATPQEVK